MTDPRDTSEPHPNPRGRRENNPGRRNLKRPNEVVKDRRGRDPRKGNLKTAESKALYPLTVERAVPLRLNK